MYFLFTIMFTNVFFIGRFGGIWKMILPKLSCKLQVSFGERLTSVVNISIMTPYYRVIVMLFIDFLVQPRATGITGRLNFIHIAILLHSYFGGNCDILLAALYFTHKRSVLLCAPPRHRATSMLLKLSYSRKVAASRI